MDESRRSMHPAYFETRFRTDVEPGEWPHEFVIISAYATTGEQWTQEENERADAELEAALEEWGIWMDRVEGFSPKTGHSEPSWAVALPLHVACDLGQRFRQDAIFHVRGDALSVTRCDERRALVRVGAFRERVEPFPHEWERHDSPWQSLTAEALVAAFDRRLVRASSAVKGTRGLVLLADEPIRVADALIDALPDDACCEQPAEGLELDYITMDDLATLLPEMSKVRWVIECEVTDSMVGGVWGLAEFTLAGRGYLYYRPDVGADEDANTSILASWREADGAVARRACILATYARFWEHIGLPPLLGQWVSGDPEILHRAVTEALRDCRREQIWHDLVEIIEREAHSWSGAGKLNRIAAEFGVPFTTLARVVAMLADSGSAFRDRIVQSGATEQECEALSGLFLDAILAERRPSEPPADFRWLGPVRELVGRWEIGYAGDDGMIEDEPSAELLLRADGSFRWEPGPAWLGSSGTWGLEVDAASKPKLCFETEQGARYANYVVLMDMDRWGTFFHWQRTRADAVIFKDRILRGCLLDRE